MHLLTKAVLLSKKNQKKVPSRRMISLSCKKLLSLTIFKKGVGDSMDPYQRYELRRIHPQGGEYEIVIHLADHLSEFANEMGTLPRERKDVLSLAKQIVKERYPNIKVTMVKVMIGGMVITSLPLMSGNDSEVEASTIDSLSQVTQDGSIYYLVTSGDTLWIISRKFNTTADNIKLANHLTSDTVKPNQRLIIPKAFHTVETGDYLTVIAKKYGTLVAEIKEANNLTNDSTRLGQILIIPITISGQHSHPEPASTAQPQPLVQMNTYTVVAGDSLSVIAKRFGTTVAVVRSNNHLTSDLLRIGQTLTIPKNVSAPPSQEKESSATEQTNNTYIVVPGDSLSLIAKRFNTTVEALRTSNHLTSDIIKIGHVLTIPTGVHTTEKPSGTGEVITPTVIVAPTTYTIVNGDNLWAIAQKFGITVAALKSVNNLTTDVLQIGQTLQIPKSIIENTPPTPVKEITPETSHTPAPETAKEERTTFTYSVRSGDSLSVIANRFGVTVDVIRTENQLTSDTLQVGQSLTIPNGLNEPELTGANTITYTTHTVVSGDNIWNLSIRYGIPQNELLRENNLTTRSLLSIGQKLKIPVHHIAVKSVVSEKYGEYLDWWTEAQYIFPIEKMAKVTDFATGKSFFIQRTIGANRADSETISMNDSNIAKSIWGGFSWIPRAVILEIDGRRIAASMSFMPHERESIANNGITGHFDVYFGNSTRHKDGKTDASHQAQVERAAGLR